MDLGGRIIVVFLIVALSIYLLDLKEPVHDFLYSILTLPSPRYYKSTSLYHFVKFCIFLIAIVGLVKILGKS